MVHWDAAPHNMGCLSPCLLQDLLSCSRITTAAA